MKRLSWLKARKLKKLGYFKLPKTGRPWIGTSYTWARIWDDGKVMPYSDEYLATTSIYQIAFNNLDATKDNETPAKQSPNEREEKDQMNLATMLVKKTGRKSGPAYASDIMKGYEVRSKAADFRAQETIRETTQRILDETRGPA